MVLWLTYISASSQLPTNALLGSTRNHSPFANMIEMKDHHTHSNGGISQSHLREGHEDDDGMISDISTTEEMGAILGVSMSRAQTRLASPRTPAGIKAAIIEQGHGYFTLPLHESEQSEVPKVGVTDSVSTSPQREREDLVQRKIEFGGNNFAQGPQIPSSRETDHYLPTRRPSRRCSDPLNNRPPSPFIDGSRDPIKSSSEANDSGLLTVPSHGSRMVTSGEPYNLRRVTSEVSLAFSSTLSTASSLGDDSRFENVREQINNRIKALRDSFEESSIRMPNLPTLARLRNGRDDNISPTPNPLNRMSNIVLPKSLMGARKDNDATTDPDSASPYPHLSAAISQLEGDIVILGGYRGSRLRRRHSPHTRLWIPIKAGFNLAKINIEVGLDDEAEEAEREKVMSDGMLTHIGVVDVSRRLIKRLRACRNAQRGRLRIHDYGYDWRLSPDKLSSDLIQFLERLECNDTTTPKERRGALVIAHSLGGLITRHAVNQKSSLFSGVIYAGVPQSCVNILGPFRNGDAVMLNSNILTARANFTIRTSFVLLPLDGKCFVDGNTGEELPVDFFNTDSWLKHRFSPTIAPTLPALPVTDTKATRRSNIIESLNRVIDRSKNLHFPSRKTKHSVDGSIDSSNSGNGQSTSDSDYPSMSKSASTPHTQKQIVASASMAPHLDHGQSDPLPKSQEKNMSPSQGRADSSREPPSVKQEMEYLKRTLTRTKAFKEELGFRKDLAQTNRYPPMAVLQ